MLNPVKHGYVNNPEEYRFSSYAWFLEKAEIDFKRDVLTSSIRNLTLADDY
jgi:hypothetical protein